MKTRTKVGGALLVASMAAAAAAYLYVGKNAPERRKKAAAWMSAAEKEIVKKAKALKDVTFTEANYERIVKEVAKKYRQAKNLDPKDISAFVNTMAKHWKQAGRTAKAKRAAKAK